MELCDKYRPSEFKHVVGQPDAVRVLRGFLKRGEVPHSILFTGPSGTGKTTLARILRDKMPSPDYYEINAAESRGIDTIRQLDKDRFYAPSRSGGCRIYYLDECHQLTKKAGGDAQTALLKVLEDSPDHVYFFLATTDPQQLLNTIRTRCTEIRCKPLGHEDISGMVLRVCKSEKVTLSEDVVERIVEVADGSARAAMKILDSVVGLADEADQLSAILAGDVKRQAFDLVKMLLWETSTWKEVSAVVKGLENQDYEQLRRLILKCAAGVMLKGGKSTDFAYFVLHAFEGDPFQAGAAGFASVVRACYEVMSARASRK